MARVTVRPETFSMVHYDADRIAQIATEVAALAGIGDDVEIVVEVDETSPFGLVTTEVEGSTVTIRAESAAFEDARRPRNLSEDGTRQVLGRLLLRVADRLDPGFGTPPADAELSYRQQTAWDAYALGRFERRTGQDAQKARRRYAFRIRHGFTDVADRAFERLWGVDELTWADIEAVCAETAAARPGDEVDERPRRIPARPRG